MKKLISFILYIIVSFSAHSQDLVVTSFEQCNEPMVVNMQQKDLNGNICSLVKIQLPVIGCKFEGSIIETKFDISEYWVYLSPGAKQLNIKCPNKNTCIIKFEKYGYDGLKSKSIYNLKLQGWDVIKSETTNASGLRTPESSLAQMKKIIDNIIKIGANSIGPFKNGIAPVGKNGKYAFIDKDGNQLTAFAFDTYLTPYHISKGDGWIVKKNCLYGVINKKGNLTVDCAYKHIDVSNGFASCTNNVKVDKSGTISGGAFAKAKYDIIDIETGELIQRKVSNDVSHEMLYGEYTYPRLKNHNEFVNKFGKKPFSLKFEYAYPFSENLACVRTKRDGWIIIDQNGDVMGELPLGSFPYDGNNGIYSDGCFHEGLLAIKKDWKIGYINKYGEIVIPVQYDEGCKFSEGLAAVSVGSHYGGDMKMFYIDKKGSVIIEPTENLFQCGEFKNGIAIGELRGGLSSNDPWPQILYDKNGVVLLQGATHSFNRLIWYGSDCFKYNLFPIEKRRNNSKSFVYINSNYKEASVEFSNADMFMDEFTSILSKEGIPGIIDGYGNIVLLTSN